MNTLIQGPYRLAIIFLLISALLHLFAPLMGGFSGVAMMLLPFGFIYIALAFGLSKGWRWLAWIMFFVTAIGGIVSLSYVWTLGSLPGWWFAAITVADWLCAAMLFGALWRAPQARTATEA